MRIFLVIAALGAFFAWRAPEPVADDVGAPPPGVSAAPPEAADAGRLPSSLAALFGEPAQKPEPPADPVVHCRLADGDTFVRRSTCELAGGWPDEPGWARLD